MRSVLCAASGISAKTASAPNKETNARDFVLQTINAFPAGKTTPAKQVRAKSRVLRTVRVGVWWTCSATAVGKTTPAKMEHAHNNPARLVRTFVLPIPNANLAAKATLANSSNANKAPHHNVRHNVLWISSATDAAKATLAKAELVSHRRNLPPVRLFAQTTQSAVPAVKALFAITFNASKAQRPNVRHNALSTFSAILVGRVSVANRTPASKGERRRARDFA